MQNYIMKHKYITGQTHPQKAIRNKQKIITLMLITKQYIKNAKKVYASRIK